MPYAPGIQDISGQLLGEGMTRASNIKAQARADFGRSIADTLIGGIKQYQQNENFTTQSLAKFTERMQDPQFKQYVDNILADESNKMGVPESVKTAFRNAQTGKLKPNEASTLATIAQDYSERKKSAEESEFRKMQTALAYAQAQGVLAKASAPPAGQRMTQQQFLSLPAGLDATAAPVGDGSGDVIVKSMSNRAPEKQDVTPVNIGGETLLINKAGQTLRAIPNTSAIPAGYQVVPSASAQQAPIAGGSAMAVPEALSQFMPARSMAPADLALGAKAAGMVMQPAAGPSRTAIDSINAVQAAQGAAPAILRAPAGVPAAIASGPAAGLQPMAIRPIPGSPADIEAKGKLKAEAKARDTLQGNIDTTMNTIKSIERKASRTSVGAPGVTNLPRAAGKFFNMADSADVEALLKTLEGNIAFDALRNLKDSGTSLGQIAIKELELLKSSKGSLEQSLSYPLFMENLNRFKIQTEYAGKKLKVLNSALEKGLNEPTKDFYELDKQQSEALKALEKTPEQRLKDIGFTIKRRS
jgi:hypothetical protein